MTISGLYPVGSGHNLTEATFKREQGKMSFNIYAHNFFRFYFFFHLQIMPKGESFVGMLCR